MSPTRLLLIALASGAGVFVAVLLVRAFWRLRSEARRRAAGAPPLRSARAVIWRDPGPAARRDLGAGPGGPEGRPTPPFQFIEEHGSGTNPCVSVRDARGRVWRVKWGDEVNAETFAARLAWAAGYFVEINYFVPAGRIEGAVVLDRARACVAEDGVFCNARFELDEPGVIKHFDEHSWAWNDNPFVGTPELNGLKIMIMLVSNWDNKDVRDVARGSNTAIFESAAQDGLEARYLVIDWGAALGAWGNNILSRGRWNCQAFADQSEQLITGLDGDEVQWGYRGQRTGDAVAGIRRSDVAWLHAHLAALTDEQLASGLRASGATETEIVDFTRALRVRLDLLGRVATA